MASVKNIVEEVSSWLRVYDDGTVDRSWTGPPELKFFLNSVPPHREFIDGVATNDVHRPKHQPCRPHIHSRNGPLH
ncbi:CXE carboxylesterase [Spatholobus suberectus]|nr:CXE carboxylesterase [Spatholobus suberectus]